VANKHFEPEIECVNASTNKSDGLGELKGGMVFDVSPGMARRLMMSEGKGGVVILEGCAERLAFEVAVGRNGKVWVCSKSVRETLAVGNALVTADSEGLNVEQQRSLVKKLLKGI
jgi:exosome complex component RRP40